MSAQNGAQRCAVHGDRLAEHRSQVCGACETTVRHALRDAAGLYADLGDPRRGKALGGVRGGDKPSPMPDARLHARDAIRTALVGWCKVLEDGFACTVPADTVRAMAHHVATQAGRLLASDAAEGLVSDCRDILDLQRVAWPTRWTGVKLACPCGGTVRITVETAAETIACPSCDEWGTVDWWRERVAADSWRPMLLKDVTTWLILAHRMSVTYAQVRQWVVRRELEGYMFDDRGRVLYDPEQVLECQPAARRVA